MAERFDVGGIVNTAQLLRAGVAEGETREAGADGGFSLLEPRSDREQSLSPLGMLGRSDVLEKQVVVGKKCRCRG